LENIIAAYATCGCLWYATMRNCANSAITIFFLTQPVPFSFCFILSGAQSKKPFHCVQCGFCRVGGVEAFRHCQQCCMCISVSVFDTHQCFKDKYKNNCPVCREDMFSSRQSPQDLPCGHAIHAHCFRKLAGFDYRCPICKKTVVSQQSMAAAWEARARDIAEHPMPADLQRIVDIMCNDCEAKSPRRQWHFLGIQCPDCNSFNTVVEQVLSSGADALANNNPNAASGGSA
jgi:RING finger/CHY zinc finger protein 1